MFTNKSEVEFIDSMGSDLSVVNAARVSFNKRKEKLDDKDIKLIQYLADHNHWTPFAHTALTFRIKTPIFVARHLHKHQVGLVVNEVSRRYVTDAPEFYFPDEFRGVAEDKKQGSSGSVKLTEKQELNAKINLEFAADLYYNLTTYAKVAPEMARMFLPQNLMTTFYWTGSLVAFARVCKLRIAPDVQQETQDVAKEIWKKIPTRFFYSWEALDG